MVPVAVLVLIDCKENLAILLILQTVEEVMFPAALAALNNGSLIILIMIQPL
jgi:hypothetical protein